MSTTLMRTSSGSAGMATVPLTFISFSGWCVGDSGQPHLHRRLSMTRAKCVCRLAKFLNLLAIIKEEMSENRT